MVKMKKKLTDLNKFSLEELISFMPGHVYWVNKDNVYLGCNELQAKSNGLASAKEVIGKRNKDLPCFKDRPDIPITLDKNNLEIMHTGLPRTLEELTVINGEEKVALTQKVPLKNKNGEVVGLLGISFDITERKKAEKKLQASKQSLQLALETIIANLPGHVYWKDKKGVFLGANDSQAQTLGYSSAEEIIGKTAYDTIPKEYADEIIKTDQAIMSSGQPSAVEEFSPNKEGEKAIYLSKKVPLFDDKKQVIGLLGISMDITELKKAQKALADQKLYQSQTHFISIASHEVRGPVGNAINLLELSQEYLDRIKDLFHGEVLDALNSAGKTELVNQFNELYHQISSGNTIAHQEAHRALNSLISIGELFALQRDGIKVSTQKTNMNELIDSVLEKVNKTNYQDVEFRVEISKDFPQTVMFDQRNISQALFVFIGNAVRFSRERGLVKIQVKNITQSHKDYIQINIQDFGVGISESQIESLFSMAVAENEDRSHQYRKPSLHLPQAKMKIEASGGTVEINSIVGKGTTVTITLPLEQNAKQYVTPIKENQLAPAPAIPQMKLLLVEDDLRTQEMLKKSFQELGQQVDAATTGQKAIELALANYYDIIFIDITLPDMSGLDVLKSVRKEKRDSTFVAITSHASEEDQDYFTSDEIDIMTVLTKPVSKQDLKACLEDVVIAKSQADD